MKYFYQIFYLFSFTILTFSCIAQVPSDSAGHVRKEHIVKVLLKNLTYEEKVQLLEYNRFLGASVESELLWSMAQLDSASQVKSLNNMLSLLVKGGKPLRTTVKWDRDTVFIGKQQEGSIFRDTLSVFNTGQNPYFITDIKASCDCTVAKIPETLVMPGESVRLPISFDTREKQGIVAAAIVFQDNSAPNSRSIIYLKGEVYIPKRSKPSKH